MATDDKKKPKIVANRTGLNIGVRVGQKDPGERKSSLNVGNNTNPLPKKAKGPTGAKAWQSASDKAQKNAEDRRLGGMGGSRESIAAHARDKRLAMAGQGAEEDAQVPGLMDFLNQVLGGMGEDQTAQPSYMDFSSVRKNLNDRAGQGDQRLADVYRQLQGQYEGAGAGVKDLYDQSSQTVDQNFDQAAQNNTESADSIRGEQTRQLAALGIGDAIDPTNDRLARETQLSRQSLEENRAANKNALTQTGTAAQTFNNQMGQAASMSGANKRADLMAQLQSKMAETDMAEQQNRQQADQTAASANAQGQSQRYAQALQMAKALLDEQQWNTTRNDNLGQSAAEQAQAMAELKYQQERDTFDNVGGGPNADTVKQIIAMLTNNGIGAGDDNFSEMYDAIRKTR